MVTIDLKWNHFSFVAKEVDEWRHLKKKVRSENEHSSLLSSYAVYAVRICRPFAFGYPKKASPLAYIGEGDAKKRISSHIGGWMFDLASEIPSLEVEIWYANPKLKRRGPIHKTVEADLLKRFVTAHGELPIRNQQQEHKYASSYTYSSASLKVLRPGSGKGFYYALRPLKSSGLYKFATEKRKSVTA